MPEIVRRHSTDAEVGLHAAHLRGARTCARLRRIAGSRWPSNPSGTFALRPALGGVSGADPRKIASRAETATDVTLSARQDRERDSKRRSRSDGLDRSFRSRRGARRVRRSCAVHREDSRARELLDLAPAARSHESRRACRSRPTSRLGW